MRILVAIPTRDRPEYLSCLLSSLIFQTCKDFDVMIADTSSGGPALEVNPMFLRFRDTLHALGHEVFVYSLAPVGRSEAMAVNFMMLEAQHREYSYIYKVDDDHILPPGALERLVAVFNAHDEEGPAIFSGVTPWMHQTWEDAAGPSSVVAGNPDDFMCGEYLTSIVRNPSGNLDLEPRHFSRYESDEVCETQLASAANFFMVPDTRILFSDTGYSSLFADAVWFLQLRKFLGYKMYFDLGLEAWHVAAPSGGVRDSTGFGNYIKDTPWDDRRRDYLSKMYAELVEAE